MNENEMLNPTIINFCPFCPYMEAKSEDGEVVFAGTVSMRMNRAILKRRANPAMNIHSLARNGAYGATVTSVQDNYYRLIVDVGNIQARVARTASDELLTRGDRVTLLVYGYDDKRNYVWGACHKA